MLLVPNHLRALLRLVLGLTWGGGGLSAIGCVTCRDIGQAYRSGFNWGNDGF